MAETMRAATCTHRACIAQRFQYADLIQQEPGDKRQAHFIEDVNILMIAWHAPEVSIRAPNGTYSIVLL